MDDHQPPLSHYLRPHHVALLTVFTIAFKDTVKPLPPTFMLHIYRVLMNQVSEVAQPLPYTELLREIGHCPEHVIAGKLLEEAILRLQKELNSADQITTFFSGIPPLFVEKSEDEPAIFMRRSLFGYFCRRCFVSFLKLSFSGVVQLQLNYQAWCAGDSEAGYHRVSKEQLNDEDMLVFRTQVDKKMWAEPEAFEAWDKGLATGDENYATENLRRFFEQHFHEGNDSGLRQHALINLVRMHYNRQEYKTASKYLSEAITVARTSGDRLTLQHCISLANRIPPTDKTRPVLNELQPDINPLETLFDVSKLMQSQSDQPLSASFERMGQAMGLYDHWLDVQQAAQLNTDQWAHHAVQSVVWAQAGCTALAAIEEDTVIAFTSPNSDDNNRITVILNKAYRLARQGQYQESLCMLLNPSVWRGLMITDYNLWASQIWHILVLRASRRGQHRLYREYLEPRRPPGDFDPRDYFFDQKSTTPSVIRDELYEVIQARQHHQAGSTLDQLLKALWHSEFQCRFSYYRTSVILLADLGLEFGMTKRSREILEEIMPQVIVGDDVEQRAFACFILARSIIASGSSSVGALKEALPFLLLAENDFQRLGMLRSMMDVQYLISVVHHNLGQERECEVAAEKHFATEVEHKAVGALVMDAETRDILEVVSQVGAALAAR